MTMSAPTRGIEITREVAIAEGWHRDNPSGRCMCGCGQVTALGGQGSRIHRTVGGEHMPFMPGHHAQGAPCRPGCTCKRHKRRPSRIDRLQAIREGWLTPNDGGACECGCGKPAPVAVTSDRRDGTVRGECKHFARGSWCRFQGGRAKLGDLIHEVGRARSVSGWPATAFDLTRHRTIHVGGRWSGAWTRSPPTIARRRSVHAERTARLAPARGRPGGSGRARV